MMAATLRATSVHVIPGGLSQRNRVPRILVVDDEPLIRMIASDILEAAGYEVVEAGTAREALDLIEVEPDRFTHVFTDAQMPGELDGMGLAQLVNSLYSDIRVVVTSGDPALSESPDTGSLRFVAKPWTTIDVLNVVTPAG